MRRLTLLPLTVLLAFGLLGKVTVLGDRIFTGVSARQVVPVANASEGAASHGGDEKESHGGDKGEHGGDAKPAKQEAKACPPPPPPPEPTGPTFSESELAVLQQLAQRRDELSQREADLQRRESVLAAAETRIDEKVASLKQLQTTLGGLIRQHDEEQANKLRSLVKIYETMKPADAARIFEQLDLDTLLPVVERMNERKLAAILANLDPTKAKDVTVELKKLREVATPPRT